MNVTTSQTVSRMAFYFLGGGGGYDENGVLERNKTPEVRSGLRHPGRPGLQPAGSGIQRAVPGLPSPCPPPAPARLLCSWRRPRYGEARTRGAGPRSARELPARVQGCRVRVRGTRQSSRRLRQRRAWVAGRSSPPARRLRRAGCSFRWSRDLAGA